MFGFTGVETLIFGAIAFFTACALGVFLLTIWVAGRNSNRGGFDY
jgi:cbb3-type cytochrome oxidase subunit 3